MAGHARLWIILSFSFICALVASPVAAQRTPTFVFHRVEGRLQFRGPVNAVHVRILQSSRRSLVDEAYTRDEGQFSFNSVPEGDYVIETEDTDKFAASSTEIRVYPIDRRRSEVFRVTIQLELKPIVAGAKPAVIAADVDLHVPKDAQKHYREAVKAVDSGAHERAVAELQAALRMYPDYYAARLDLGRELRAQKRFKEAAEILEPLARLAPNRAEPRIEYALVLVALNRRAEATKELRAALELEETNWVTHFYLGMALMEEDAANAEQHLRRAIELNERKAARAYLSLARLAAARGQRQLAIEHLQAYLKLSPDAPDAEAVQSLIERLRSKN
ncbi:MAG TPA: tetratricopeptide repeat protein [Pyrinomonadaceae bacterium]|nr:tetratricopeptide repeat protein [Pyrinomonadaceae bacterium]